MLVLWSVISFPQGKIQPLCSAVYVSYLKLYASVHSIELKFRLVSFDLFENTLRKENIFFSPKNNETIYRNNFDCVMPCIVSQSTIIIFSMCHTHTLNYAVYISNIILPRVLLYCLPSIKQLDFMNGIQSQFFPQVHKSM